MHKNEKTFGVDVGRIVCDKGLSKRW